MSSTNSLQSRSRVSARDHSTKLQVVSALVGLGFLVAGLWLLRVSDVTDVQYIMGMLGSLGIALVIALGGFVVAARKNTSS